MDNEIIMNGFIRKNDTIEYNYDLEPLINEFNKKGIYALIDSTDIDSPDNGGYLAITENQYVLALNYKYGKGTHLLAAARIYSEITGKKLDSDKCLEYAVLMERHCAFIHGRLHYECNEIDDSRRKLYTGNIYFMLGKRRYSSKTIEMFLQFYNDYNKEIASICNKYHFDVYMVYETKDGYFSSNISKNLDNLKEYILSMQDDNIQDYFKENNLEERIIGTPKKKVLTKIKE